MINKFWWRIKAIYCLLFTNYPGNCFTMSNMLLDIYYDQEYSPSCAVYSDKYYWHYDDISDVTPRLKKIQSILKWIVRIFALVVIGTISFLMVMLFNLIYLLVSAWFV